jgi:hypothetical protein
MAPLPLECSLSKDVHFPCFIQCCVCVCVLWSWCPVKKSPIRRTYPVLSGPMWLSFFLRTLSPNSSNFSTYLVPCYSFLLDILSLVLPDVRCLSLVLPDAQCLSPVLPDARYLFLVLRNAQCLSLVLPDAQCLSLVLPTFCPLSYLAFCSLSYLTFCPLSYLNFCPCLTRLYVPCLT